jgi:hypothetical protein
MGRGRNKAKQQKVARVLKYTQQQPDFEALSRELSDPGRRTSTTTRPQSVDNPSGGLADNSQN